MSSVLRAASQASNEPRIVWSDDVPEYFCNGIIYPRRVEGGCLRFYYFADVLAFDSPMAPLERRIKLCMIRPVDSIPVASRALQAALDAVPVIARPKLLM